MRRWAKFKLRAMLGFITIVSVGLGFVMYHRSHGLDQLVDDLNQFEARLFFKDELVVDNGGGEVRTPPRSSAWDQLLGASTSDLTEVWINKHGYESSSRFDSRLCRRLSNSIAAHSITKLGLCRSSFGADAEMFFANWRSLRYLEFRDTSIPDSWKKQLDELTQIEEVVISGAGCNIDPLAFASCKKLKRIRLANRGISRQQLTELQSTLFPIQIQLIGSFDSRWEFESAQSLSTHDPTAYQEMKALVDKMHQSLAKFDPPVLFHFNPAATESEIASLERTVGMPLPKYVRALLEIQNGQNAEHWKPSRWLSCQEMIATHNERLDCNELDPEYYDFEPLYDWCTNPNYLQIAEGMGVSLVDGSLAGINDQDGPWSVDRIADLQQLFERYVVHIEAQRAEANSSFEVHRGTLLLAPDFWMND